MIFINILKLKKRREKDFVTVVCFLGINGEVFKETVHL